MPKPSRTFTGRDEGELTETVPVIAQGLAAVKVLALEIEKARTADDSILNNLNLASLGIIAGSKDNG